MFPKYEKMEQIPGVCDGAQGMLPSCAPLATPCVPVQPEGTAQYTEVEALENGTLFPDLNLPFKLKTTPGKVAQTPLTELQALEFVVHELGLYLDTHKEDTQAMELFRKYAALAREGKARYEMMYGPLTKPATAECKGWVWIRDPWPWNVQEGGKQ